MVFPPSAVPPWSSIWESTNNHRSRAGGNFGNLRESQGNAGDPMNNQLTKIPRMILCPYKLFINRLKPGGKANFQIWGPMGPMGPQIVNFPSHKALGSMGP